MESCIRPFVPFVKEKHVCVKKMFEVLIVEF